MLREPAANHRLPRKGGIQHKGSGIEMNDHELWETTRGSQAPHPSKVTLKDTADEAFLILMGDGATFFSLHLLAMALLIKAQH